MELEWWINQNVLFKCFLLEDEGVEIGHTWPGYVTTSPPYYLHEHETEYGGV